MKSEIKRAVEWAGSRAGLASRCGVSERTVQHWLANGRMPATPALLIEQLTKCKIKAKGLTQRRRTKAAK